ncbi:MAG: archease [Desulfosoma sp.]
MERALYEIVDHTADVGIRVQGRDLAEVFERAALAFYDLMVGLDAVEIRQSREVCVEAQALDELLVQWLSELLYLFDVQGFLGKAVQIAVNPSWRLTATVHGEPLDPDRHRVGLVYKAVTYHAASVKFTDGLWTAQVIFDI